MLTARLEPDRLLSTDLSTDTESSTDRLAARCRGWRTLQGDEASLGFQDIVASALGVLGLYQRELAAEFQVAESTVSRWASGAARPHPRLQALIVAAIGKRVARAVGKARKLPLVKTGKTELKTGLSRRAVGGHRSDASK